MENASSAGVLWLPIHHQDSISIAQFNQNVQKMNLAAVENTLCSPAPVPVGNDTAEQSFFDGSDSSPGRATENNR